MPEISVTGGNMQEVNKTTTELYHAQQLVNRGQPQIIEEMIEVEETLNTLTENQSSIRRNKIEDAVDIKGGVYQHLQLLQSYGIVSSSGQGGNWKHTGD
jgi:murein L,D-transpeptidase YafK